MAIDTLTNEQLLPVQRLAPLPKTSKSGEHIQRLALGRST